MLQNGRNLKETIKKISCRSRTLWYDVFHCHYMWDYASPNVIIWIAEHSTPRTTYSLKCWLFFWNPLFCGFWWLRIFPSIDYLWVTDPLFSWSADLLSPLSINLIWHLRSLQVPDLYIGSSFGIMLDNSKKLVCHSITFLRQKQSPSSEFGYWSRSFMLKITHYT